MYIAWRGERAALALTGFVYQGEFHGRAFFQLGWRDVTIPLSEFRNLFRNEKPS